MSEQTSANSIEKKPSSNEEESSNKTQPPLSSIVVDTQTKALLVLFEYLNIANKRGAFTLDESAKIFECIQWFQQKRDQN